MEVKNVGRLYIFYVIGRADETMTEKRIMLIGCGGSGKSTLASQLGSITGIPVVHLDQLFWRPGWQHISQEKFNDLLREVVAKDTWIVDGNFDRTIDLRLERCDTVIYLDYSRWTCLYSALKRVLMNWGKTRPDMGTDCPERIDLEFFKWIWDFNKTHRIKYCNLLDQLKDKNIYILHRRSEGKVFLDKMRHAFTVGEQE